MLSHYSALLIGRLTSYCITGVVFSAMVALVPKNALAADTANDKPIINQQQQTIAIRSQPLQHAIVEFVQQTGVGIVVDTQVDTSVIVPPVNGLLTHAQALNRLLAGHALEAVNHDNRYYLIRPTPKDTTPSRSSHNTRPEIEEIVVTGSWTQPWNFPNASNISIWNSTRFTQAGLVSAADLISYIPSVTGTENQSNQFDNNFSAGTSNINLRGLGVSRTLVLLNGRRTVTSAIPHNDGQSYVDLNSLPWNAIERVELLKDGAAATYGSDAIAGVVNLISQKPPKGLELKGQYKAIDESDGDWNLSAIWGYESDNLQLLTSFEYVKRHELTVVDREEITAPRVDISSTQQIVFGQSPTGNPGSFIPIDALSAAGGISEDELNQLAISDNNVADPGCAASLGIPLADNRCGYQYVLFDNLVEQEVQQRFFSSAQWYLNESQTLYSELLISHTEVPHWKTSPSYAPREEVDLAYYVPADHPGLQAFTSVMGDTKTLAGDSADFSGGALFMGRTTGGSADIAQQGKRDYKTYRILMGSLLEHEQSSTDVSMMYARNHATAFIPDTHKARWQQALLGFGGPNCQGDVAGSNGCEYYNPFSSALQASPIYDENLTNSEELLAWMVGRAQQSNTAQLATFDILHQGSLSELPASYAIGAQLRYEDLEIRFSEDARLDSITDIETPPINDLIFFAGGENDNLNQTVAAVFFEARIPATDDLELQLALRYEDYLDLVGSSIDPKIAAHWRFHKNVSLRASASTSFRAPSLNQTGQNTTTQEYIGYASGFKSIYRIGNPELNAEQATNFNLGLLWQHSDLLTSSIDLWHITLEDPIVQQSANDIVNDVTQNPDSIYRNQVIFDSGDRLSHIITHYINGPNVTLEGADINVNVTLLDNTHLLRAGVNAAYLHRYQVEATNLRQDYDAVGHSNTGTFLQPLPQWKGNMWLSLERGNHFALLRWNYVDGYVDEGLSILQSHPDDIGQFNEQVGSFATWDFSYRYQWHKTQATLTLNNLSDKMPPEVNDEIRFESSLHNAFGRTVTLSLKHQF